MAPPPAFPYAAGFTPTPGSSVPGGENPDPSQDPSHNPGVGSSYQQPPVYTAPYTAPPTPGSPGMPPGYTEPLAIEPRGQRHPVGAIVLIAIGLLLLLHTLGIFEDEWIAERGRSSSSASARGCFTAEPASFPREVCDEFLAAHSPAARTGFPHPGWHHRLAQSVGVLSFGRSWPLYLILAGVIGLAERAALIATPSRPSRLSRRVCAHLPAGHSGASLSRHLVFRRCRSRG